LAFHLHRPAARRGMEDRNQGLQWSVEWHPCRLGGTGGAGEDNVVAATGYVERASASSMNPSEADVWLRM
jgi:hypothetical protein